MQGDPTSPSQRRSVLGVHWKDCVEAKAPVFWPPDVKSQPIGKDSHGGKEREEKGAPEDEMVGWHP